MENLNTSNFDWERQLLLAAIIIPNFRDIQFRRQRFFPDLAEQWVGPQQKPAWQCLYQILAIHKLRLLI